MYLAKIDLVTADFSSHENKALGAVQHGGIGGKQPDQKKLNCGEDMSLRQSSYALFALLAGH